MSTHNMWLCGEFIRIALALLLELCFTICKYHENTSVLVRLIYRMTRALTVCTCKVIDFAMIQYQLVTQTKTTNLNFATKKHN